MRGETKKIHYPTYNEAANAARKLRITSQKEYSKRYREDPFLPTCPNVIYKNDGWISLSHFLTGQIKEFYPTYQEAANAARRLNLKKQKEYQKEYKRDPRLPPQPNRIYASKGWVSWSVFLRNEQWRSFYPTYDEAAIAARKLGTLSSSQYSKKYKKDSRLPRNPAQVYQNKGWVSWFAFLGNQKSSFYETHDEAAMAARKLGIKSQIEYKNKYKTDPQLPANPNSIYKNKGWVSLSFFLFGKENMYPTYKEAQIAARTLGLKTAEQYRQGRKQDPQLPAGPHSTYEGKGWISWSIFLRDETWRDLYETYDEARAAVQKLGIKTYKQYHDGDFKKDPRLPRNPDQVYKNKGWISFTYFLRNQQWRVFYKTCDEASRAARNLGIRTQKKYAEKYKEDSRLPRNPGQVYKNKGWVSFPHFLGTDR